MFISRVTICNLFAYYGEVSVDFPKHDGKNLYCIYGNNGFGKTSFIRCAKLLFLGAGFNDDMSSTISRFFSNEGLPSYDFIMGGAHWSGVLNKNAINEKSESFFVSFEGYLNDRFFQLKRTWLDVYLRHSIKEELEFQYGHETFKGSIAQDKIDLILPMNFVEFFFFDGEELSEISKNLRAGFRDKMEEILHIKPLDLILHKIDSYRNELEASVLENEKKHQEYLKLSSNIHTSREIIDIKKNSLSNMDRTIRDKQNDINELENKKQKLIMDSSAELGKLYGEKEVFKNEMLKNKEKLKENLAYSLCLSNDNLLKELKNEIKAIQDSHQQMDLEVLGKLIPDIKDHFNEELSKEDLSRLGNIEEIKELLIDILEKLPEKLRIKIGIESIIPMKIIEELNATLAIIDRNSLASNLTDIKENKINLRRTDDAINAMNVDSHIEKRKKDIESKINILKKLLTESDENRRNLYEELQNDIRDQENNLVRLSELQVSINKDRIESKIKILESLKLSIKSYESKLVDRLRIDLSSRVLQNYKRLLPNDNICYIEISDDFEIICKDSNENHIIVNSQSSGQNQILAISIFWALSDLSNSKVPLIVDTPLSRIDLQNRINIIENFYSQENQVIILPHSGEMGRVEYEHISPHLAEIYKIHNEASRSRASIVRVSGIDEILEGR